MTGSIQIQCGGKEVQMSLEEARQVYNQLVTIFGQPYQYPSYPYTPLPYTPNPVYPFPLQPWTPYVTCSCQSNTGEKK